MYGRKKRVLRTYQIKRSIYFLKHGDLSVAFFYAALKTKWEELDYHVNDDWKCGSDHELYWQKEWMDHTFIFLEGLRDEFESIRSHILNCDEIPGIEEVYVRVESEEQRRQVMHIDSSHGISLFAFVSRAPGIGQRTIRRCNHCNKLGHSVDFCWDLHPEKRLTHGRPPSGRRGPPVPNTSSPSVEKPKFSSDQIKELQAYISQLSTTNEEASTSEGAELAQALVATSDQGNPLLGDWVYTRKEKDVVEPVDVTNPNPVSSPNEPSPMNKELPIALRKGTRKRLFSMINDLPTVFEVVSERKPAKEKLAADSGSKPRPSTKRSSDGMVKNSSKPADELDGYDEDDEEHSETLCGSCGGNYNADEFWIGCDICERWFHGKCVKITPAKAESIKQYKCPSCMKKGK
ncbi:PHD finger protein ALFIN-LIKE 2 [Nymphaea thermarum]|nr:PHD finger protein ALFIN-LIKE 2 [Nymphaea thermarum]